MSLAPDAPPIVNIPLRARRAGGAPGSPAPYRHLSLVTVPIADLGHGHDIVSSPATVLNQRVEPIRADTPLRLTAPLRLTRRGEWVAGLSVALAGGLMLLVAHLSAGSTAAGSMAPAPQQVTVRSGDTLWSIAHEIAPGSDPRAVVDKIKSQNQLGSVSLAPGQVLRVG